MLKRKKIRALDTDCTSQGVSIWGKSEAKDMDCAQIVHFCLENK